MNLSESSTQKWDAELYGARASFVHRMAADLVDLLAPRPGEHVLDLGCGTGELAAVIAGSGATVVGLDASADMLDAARQRSPHLNFALGHGERLEYSNEFDAVFSNAALHWMLRAEDVVRGVARALRPEGRFVAEFGGKGCILEVREGVGTALKRRGEDPNAWFRWYFPDVAEYVALLDAAGFDVKLAHLFDRPTPLDGADGLAVWLKTFLPKLESRFGDDWLALVREVEDACAPKLLRGGRWVLDYVRLRVVAVLR